MIATQAKTEGTDNDTIDIRTPSGLVRRLRRESVGFLQCLSGGATAQTRRDRTPRASTEIPPKPKEDEGDE